VPHIGFIYALAAWVAVSLALSYSSGSYTVYHDGARADDTIQPWVAATRYLYILVGAWLLYIYASHVMSEWPAWEECTVAFSASTIYYAITYVFGFWLDFDLPEFLSPLYGDERFRWAFPGYAGASGLTAEYAITVFAFAVVGLRYLRLSIRANILSVAAILLSILFVFSTSSRSGMLGLALAVSVLFLVRVKRERGKALAIAVALLSLAMIAIPLLQSSPYYYKLAEKLDLTKATIAQGTAGQDMDTLLNRPYRAALGELVQRSGWVGAGPFLSQMMLGSELVSHSLLANWIARIGFVGLALQVGFLYRIGMDLRKARRLSSVRERGLVVMFWALMPALFLNQIFHCYEMTSAANCRMWLLFAMIAVLSRQRAEAQPGLLADQEVVAGSADALVARKGRAEGRGLSVRPPARRGWPRRPEQPEIVRGSGDAVE
jgi:hypothetical protein